MPSDGTRKLIVWDLDDVLNEFTRDWLRLAWKVEHPECDVAYDDLRSNPPLASIGATLEEYLSSIDRFRLSGAAKTMRPNWMVKDWFNVHGHQFRHAIVTARPAHTVGFAAEWVNTYFDRWIHGFHVAPSHRTGTEDTPHKADVLKYLAADIFIDDSITNVQDAGDIGVTTFLFPQPWNTGLGYSLGYLLSELARMA